MVSYYLDLWCKSYCILNNFVKESLIKSKINKLGCVLGKPLVSEYDFIDDSIIFRPKLWEKLNFE